MLSYKTKQFVAKNYILLEGKVCQYLDKFVAKYEMTNYA